jgi:hypothetical protein
VENPLFQRERTYGTEREAHVQVVSVDIGACVWNAVLLGPYRARHG